jgi:hypothetical protein
MMREDMPFFNKIMRQPNQKLFPAPLHMVSKDLLLTAVLLTEMCGPTLSEDWSFSSHCPASLSYEMV